MSERLCDDQSPTAPTQCQLSKPPKNADLFPKYAWAGWWCYQTEGQTGQGSYCVKSKAVCEWSRQDTAKTLGAAQSGACVSSDDAHCFTTKGDGTPDYVCTSTNEHCEQLLATIVPPSEMHNSAVEVVSSCEPWKFKSKNQERRVEPRIPKHGFTLKFALDKNDPRPLRTVRLLRLFAAERVAGPMDEDSATAVSLADGIIAVHLPSWAREEETKKRVVELLSDDDPWTAHHVVDNRPLMDAVATFVSSTGIRPDLQVQVAMEANGAPYLIATNREVFMLPEQAAERECEVPAGGGECSVGGDEVLRDFIHALYEGDTTPGLALNDDQFFAYERSGEQWRTRLLKTGSLIDGSELLWASVQWVAGEDNLVVVPLWTEAGKRQMSMPSAGHSGAIAVVSASKPPQVRSLMKASRDRGRQVFVPMNELGEGDDDELARFENASRVVNTLLSGIPMGVTLKSTEH